LRSLKGVVKHGMSRSQLSTFFIHKLLLAGIIFLSSQGMSLAQLAPASPPIADPRDQRFEGVAEDFSTPSLKTSNLRPLRALIGSKSDSDSGYSVELIQVQWRWGDPIELYVMRPTGVEKPAVILHLYGYPSDTKIFQNPKFQKFVTKGGFAAVGFVTALTGHRYHDVPLRKWFVSDLQECLAASAHDVQEVLNYLGARGDLDMDRVGLFGQLSGASISILASAVDPRIKVLDTLDPWGDWPTWMATSPFVPKDERANYVQADFLKKVAALDPVDWIPKVQAKKFRLQQRSFENETPAASKQKLQAAASPNTTVVWYKTRDEFAASIGSDGGKNLDWIKDQLRSLPKPAPATAIAAEKVDLRATLRDKFSSRAHPTGLSSRVKAPQNTQRVKSDALSDCQFVRTQNNLGSPFNFHTLFTPDNLNKMLNSAN